MNPTTIVVAVLPIILINNVEGVSNFTDNNFKLLKIGNLKKINLLNPNYQKFEKHTT